MIPVFLLSRTIYDSTDYHKTDLILHCQALEAFHRLFHGGEYMTETEFEPVLQHLVSQIPESVCKPLRDRLTKTISFGYQYSQRKRFTELMRSLPVNIRKVLDSNSSAFIERVLQTRNFLTHSDAFSVSDVIADEDIGVANLGLGTLLHCLFAKELGIPVELIEERLGFLGCYRRYKSNGGPLVFPNVAKSEKTILGATELLKTLTL